MVRVTLGIVAVAFWYGAVVQAMRGTYDEFPATAGKLNAVWHNLPPAYGQTQNMLHYPLQGVTPNPVYIHVNASPTQHNDHKQSTDQSQKSDQNAAHQQLLRLVHEQKQASKQQEQMLQRLDHASKQVSDQKHVHTQLHALLHEQRQATAQNQETVQRFLNEQHQVTQQQQEVLQRLTADLKQVSDQFQNQLQRQAQLQDQLMAQKTVTTVTPPPVPVDPRYAGLSLVQWLMVGGSCWVLSHVMFYYYLNRKKTDDRKTMQRPGRLRSPIDKKWLMCHFHSLKHSTQHAESVA